MTPEDRYDLEIARAHLDDGGRFSHRNGVALLEMAERAAQEATDWRYFAMGAAAFALGFLTMLVL